MVSITRTPSSGATIPAGTRPPRVIATIAWNGPAAASRQASARASRWNSSHETGKCFSGMFGGIVYPQQGAAIVLPRAAKSQRRYPQVAAARRRPPSQRLEPAHDRGAGDARRREMAADDLDIAAARILGGEVEGIFAAARRDRIEGAGHPHERHGRHRGGVLRHHGGGRGDAPAAL